MKKKKAAEITKNIVEYVKTDKDWYIGTVIDLIKKINNGTFEELSLTDKIFFCECIRANAEWLSEKFKEFNFELEDCYTKSKK